MSEDADAGLRSRPWICSRDHCQNTIFAVDPPDSWRDSLGQIACPPCQREEAEE